jgi:AmmeMemoRadiSam system protein B
MTREPFVAGQFYPASPSKLEETVRRQLKPSTARQRAKSVVAPHAGYVYSGAVAGEVYSAVEIPKRIILLGPNHTGMGTPLSLHPPEPWRTPLGLALPDEELTFLLERENSALVEDRRAHVREHSIEVQIPFLQVLQPELKLSSICVGTSDLRVLQELGHSMARAIAAAAEPVLMISSSDMNHYESAAVSAEKDRWAIERVVSLDSEGLHRGVHDRDISMCGYAPTVAVLTASRDLGAAGGRLVRYAHSGEVSGDYDRVVGYAGIVIE